MDALLGLDDLIDDEDDEELAIEPPAGAPVTEAVADAAAVWREPPARPAPPPAAGASARATVPAAAQGSAGWAFQPVSARGGAASTRPQNTQERSAAAAAAAAARPDMTVDKFSGLRIKGRVVGSMVVEERLRDMKVLRLPHIRGEIEGAWAVVAALAEKTGTKEASNGKKFGIWTLTDLDGTSMKLFVFGEAFSEHWKEMETSVLAVVGARVKREEGGGGGVTLSVEKAGQLFKLGLAADFARCKADRKDGRPCSMAVNRAVSEYCCFHAAAAVKQMRTGRMELSTGGNLAFSLRRAAEAAAGGRGAGRGGAGRGGASSGAGYGIQKPLGGVRPAQKATPEEMQRIATSGVGRINSQGSRFLLNIVAPGGSAAASQPAAAGRGSGGGGARGTVAPPAPLSAQERMRLLGSSAPQLRNAPLHAPAAQRGPVVMIETDIFDDDNEAMAFARSVSRRVGGFSVPNPGGPRPLPAPLPPRPASQPQPPAGSAPAATADRRAPLASQPALPRAPSAASKPAPGGGSGDKRSFSDAFAAITDAADATKGSRHEDLALAEEEARTFAALDALAKREGLVDAAAKLTKMQVRAFRCSCGVVSETRRPDCAARGHGGGAVRVVKRFFACRNCRRRAFTLDSAYPARACAGCGGTDYDRAPMSNAGVGPRVDVHDGVACREALLTRGEEHAFSLKSLR